jgi:hypothetical protein
MPQHDGVVVNENGAFIPKQMFGQRERILAELDEAGVMSAQPEARLKVRRVEMPDRSREMKWLKENRHAYAVGRAGRRPSAQPRPGRGCGLRRRARFGRRSAVLRTPGTGRCAALRRLVSHVPGADV